MADLHHAIVIDPDAEPEGGSAGENDGARISVPSPPQIDESRNAPNATDPIVVRDSDEEGGDEEGGAGHVCAPSSSKNADGGDTRDGFVYRLRLRDECYYVGFSHTLQGVYRRLEAHKKGETNAWVRAHPPLEPHEIDICMGNYGDELLLTLKTASEHGIGAVRGAQFCAEVLRPAIRAEFERGVDQVSGCCFNCRERGHIGSQCTEPARNSMILPEACGGGPPYEPYSLFSGTTGGHMGVPPNPPNFAISFVSEDAISQQAVPGLPLSIFYPSLATTAPVTATTTTTGEGEENSGPVWRVKHRKSGSDGEEGGRGRWWRSSKGGRGGRGGRIPGNNNSHFGKAHRVKCYRCGRVGHVASNCFAKNHIKGYSLTATPAKTCNK